ncbi:phosphoribosylaminoimidazolesuccinocarboxamide synthase [Pseudogracilibacillus auburnensis]|uniref:Phosphoribosylaminoimidazole-succinocarboxamide synthase n=1 Tax=Pseudogracilibacillus auburnensis TaxID=1494959 RepID=A0A2V3W2N5_9BACI|nr:phosphoribosylaminoimidazolesuccinocarboxamide synthase [Pseudogracilibacillus auburnensis]MBO1002872.1 phosphoribosylaminoimidazolesuccinocarboxamide synthase [Pseudogracilibacillus auburnensis]PXW88006.1 phosphoribosylaminoimidazole-succinocarboxamide synthase [Pseudogracilibacillus auburnensis]
MELIYEGKTKDVYRLDDGTIQLKFKDDVTGEDGVFDPGANTVGLTVEGAGKSGLRMTTYFFEKLQQKNIPTHYIESNLEDVTMTVKDAQMFGNGLEVICRFRAVGSFYRRYGAYCEEGQALDGFVEVTIKDDERGDPPISKDALAALNIVTKEEYVQLKQLTKQISEIVKIELAQKNLQLYDIKLEFGRDKATNEMILIDEISGGNMRVYDENGDYIEPLKLEKRLFNDSL